MVRDLVTRLGHELRALGVSSAKLEPKWETLDQGFISIDVRSESGVGAEFSLVALFQGGVVLSLRGLAEPVEEALSDDIRGIAEAIANAARFGVVWQGVPFRRISTWPSPTIPQTRTELDSLFRSGYVRYDQAWSDPA